MSYFINEDLTQQLSNDKKNEPVIFDDCVQNILKNLNNLFYTFYGTESLIKLKGKL